MKTRPKLRLFRYLLPVVIVLALIFSVRYCGKQEKPSGHPRDYAAIAKECHWALIGFTKTYFFQTVCSSKHTKILP